MNPLLASLLAAGVGAGYGVWLRRTLNQLRYRTPDEHHQPPPGPRRWIIPTTAAAAGLLAHSAATSATPWLYLPLLPLLATGPALAAIDHDVMRLPNRILGPTALASLAGILTATIVLQHPTTAVQALLGAVLAGSVFYLTNRITHGGIGMGDVKLATLIGTTLAPLSLTLVLPALLTGSILAWTIHTIRRTHGPFAYGPWLLAGGLAAAIVGPLLAG